MELSQIGSVNPQNGLPALPKNSPLAESEPVKSLELAQRESENFSMGRLESTNTQPTMKKVEIESSQKPVFDQKLSIPNVVAGPKMVEKEKVSESTPAGIDFLKKTDAKTSSSPSKASIQKFPELSMNVQDFGQRKEAVNMGGDTLKPEKAESDHQIRIENQSNPNLLESLRPDYSEKTSLQGLPAQLVHTLNSMNSLKGKGEVKPAQTALSGGEFINTLNEIKNGAVTSNQNSSNQSQSDAEGDLNTKLGFNGLEKSDSLKSKDSKGKKSLFEENLQLGGRAPLNFSHLDSTAALKASAKPLEISAPVIQGAVKPRLTTEAMIGISNGIRNLTPHGGELRIRLKPENLGELSVRVVTHGNQVNLQIQASDEKAKKILEDGISLLKESLSVQNLTLNQVDLNASQPNSNQNGNDSNSSQHRFDQGSQFQESFGQNSNSGNQQGFQGQGFGLGTDFGNRDASRGSSIQGKAQLMGGMASQARSRTSRIDVQA